VLVRFQRTVAPINGTGARTLRREAARCRSNLDHPGQKPGILARPDFGRLQDARVRDEGESAARPRPEASFLVLLWREPSIEPPCDVHAVLITGADPAMEKELLAQLE
jgi:hypothetical protein